MRGSEGGGGQRCSRTRLVSTISTRAASVAYHDVNTSSRAIDRGGPAEPVNLYEAPSSGIYCVASSLSSGGLIQEPVGSADG